MQENSQILPLTDSVKYKKREVTDLSPNALPRSSATWAATSIPTYQKEMQYLSLSFFLSRVLYLSLSFFLSHVLYTKSNGKALGINALITLALCVFMITMLCHIQ